MVFICQVAPESIGEQAWRLYSSVRIPADTTQQTFFKPISVKYHTSGAPVEEESCVKQQVIERVGFSDNVSNHCHVKSSDVPQRR
jgi:hypothetical protein